MTGRMKWRLEGYEDGLSRQRISHPRPGIFTDLGLEGVQFLFWYRDKLTKGRADRAGRLLRAILPYLFRSHRQHLGLESIRLPDVVGLCAVLHPELFHTEELHGDVETGGEIAIGATIFDRRPNSPHRADIEVALEVDVAAVADCIVRGLADAGLQT